MSFDWVDYVYLAEELLNQPPESYLRCSISRAYYGVFCVARDRKGLQNCKYRVHQEVIDQYRSSTNRNEKAIGNILARLRKSRVDADYRGGKGFAQDDAKKAINRAKEILKRMNIAYNP